MTIQLNSKTFQTTVLEATKPVLVDFSASWCGPCQTQLPIVEDVAKAIAERAIVAKVDVDEEIELAQTYQITSIPALLIFKDGKVVKRFQGVTRKQPLVEALS